MIYIDPSLDLLTVAGVRNAACSRSPALLSAEVALLTVAFLLELLVSGHSPQPLTHLQAWEKSKNVTRETLKMQPIFPSGKTNLT